MGVLSSWPRREPRLDERVVGITFVDVLFALVIGEVLEPLRHLSDVPGTGRVHLAVAAVLTLTSWVGYHNSHNRPTHFLRFPNLPLCQFLLDICMVVTYWLVAVTAEQAHGRPHARPEAIGVAVSFILYVGWDRVGFLIRRDDRYWKRPFAHDVPRRREVTLWFAAIAVGLAVATWFWDPHSEPWVYGVDGALIILLVGFRLVKEFVTPTDALAPAPPRGDDEIITEMERLVAELRRRKSAG